MKLFDEDLSLFKGYSDGTHRSISPAETLARYQPIMRKTGITRLANITGLDVIGLPTWMAVRPNARGLSTSQGKGLTDDAAKASALMEAIETWHGENIDRPVRIASVADMGSSESITDVSRLSRYADRPIRPDLPIAWIEGRSLLHDASVWVPLESVSTSYVVAADGRSDTVFVQSSNGLASGNHLSEAVAHALAELIERDAVGLTGGEMRRAAAGRRINRHTVVSSDLQQMLSLLDRANVETVLFDLTVDTAIPVCGCTIIDRDLDSRWRRLPSFSGYGCHPSPEVALARAITEAVQSRVTQISGSRDDISQAEYLRGGNVDDLASYHRLAAAGEDAVDFAGIADQSTDCFAKDIAVMLRALADVGVTQVVAVDLRKPGIGVPVVKLVAPGLGAPLPMMRGRSIYNPIRPLSAQA